MGKKNCRLRTRWPNATAATCRIYGWTRSARCLFAKGATSRHRRNKTKPHTRKGGQVWEDAMLGRWKIVAALALLLSGPAFAADEPGISATEIKIGGVFPFSGPASSLGLVGNGVMAYIQALNDRGGINGRKINYIAYDDAYSPPKAVEHVRRLVESDEVSFIFGQLGTPGNSATAKYLKGKGVPSIAIVSGSSKFTDIAQYPVTTTGLVSYQTEGAIYAKFLDKALPGAKYAILFQNDDLGKDYVNAFKSFLKGEFEKRVVTAAYEVAEPTVDS